MTDPSSPETAGPQPGSDRKIDTGGGAYIEGNVNTGGGDIIIQAAEKPKPAKPFMVEPLPENFVARPEEFEKIISALLDRSQPNAVGAQPTVVAQPRAVVAQPTVGITAALRGAGGYGKTVLARAVCHDPRVRAAFPDGVLWVTLGENPSEQDLIARLAYLVARLTGDREQPPDLLSAGLRLRDELSQRQALLVVDDVWNGAHLRPFLQGGPRCGCLVTTRNDDTLPGGTHKINVDAMRAQEALGLISAGLDLGQPPSHAEHQRAELRRLAARLGEWPLLLSLANGHLLSLVETPYPLDKALAIANADYDRQGLNAFNALDRDARSQAAGQAIQVSVDHLDARHRARFFELAVFPEDVEIPLAALEALWGFTGKLAAPEIEALCRLLARRSLVQKFDPENNTVRLHDVMRKYLLEQQPGKLDGLHEALLEGYGQRCPGGWHTGPRDGYYFRWLAYHLAQAGQADVLAALLLDFNWLDAHLRNGGVNELLGDYEYRGTAPQEAQPHLALAQGALLMSSHVLAQDPDQLAAQLLGRLLELPGTEGLALLEQAQRWRGHAWLRPTHPCFNAPGSGELRTLSGHSYGVTAVAISPDGRLALSGSWDNTLKVWDLASGKALRTLSGHSNYVTAVAISPDGRLALSGSWDKTLKVWDLESGKELRTLSGHANDVTAVAISPDGRLALSGSWSHTLKVWDLDSGKALRTLSGHARSVHAVAISPDGRLALSGSEDNTLKVWDLASGKALRTLSGHARSVHAVAISPDGRLALSGSDDTTLKIWDLASGEELHTLSGHAYGVNVVAISPDGRLALSGSDDTTLKIWDLASGEELHTLSAHADSVNAVAISPSGLIALSGSGDKTLKVWDLDSGKCRTSFCCNGVVYCCAFHPDGQRLVAGDAGGTLYFLHFEGL
jgi:WD40 repeat protein